MFQNVFSPSGFLAISMPPHGINHFDAVRARERELEQLAQDLHRREMQPPPVPLECIVVLHVVFSATLWML